MIPLLVPKFLTFEISQIFAAISEGGQFLAITRANGPSLLSFPVVTLALRFRGTTSKLRLKKETTKIGGFI